MVKNVPKAIPYLHKILSTASFTRWRETWNQSNVARSTRPLPDYSVLMKLIACEVKNSQMIKLSSTLFILSKSSKIYMTQ